MQERLRYAPSPTGELHIGSLRTVIFDVLVARQTGGIFMVREEDTDQARLVEGSMKRQLEAMRWMGIEPDEGKCLDEQGNLTEKGSYGPYTQSKRLDIYKKHAQELIDTGKAYRCFCTSERLTEMREEQQKNHLPPRYDRLCRSLSREESDKRAAGEETFVIRQAMPTEGQTAFDDVVRGEVSFSNADLDDHVLMKSDGFPTYQLANVVDDHLMEITLVIRGEEWIPSTPKNVLLYQAFGWQPPRFAHVPVILGPDGKHKLSKRDGSVGVPEYQEKGYMPEALFNFLVFLGWSPGTEQEFFTFEELVQAFKLEKVQKSPALFNFDRLEFVNGWYVRQLPVPKVLEFMKPYLLKAELIKDKKGELYITDEIAFAHGSLNQYLLAVARAVQERMKHFGETVELTQYFFERPGVSPEMIELIVPKKATLEGTLRILKQVIETLEAYEDEWGHDELHKLLFDFIGEHEYKNGEVLWPIRASLTGVGASPGAFEMLAVLGKEESLMRLHAVIETAG